MKRKPPDADPPCRKSVEGKTACPTETCAPDIDRSAALEAQWRAASSQALKDYNARLARDGAFGDHFRRF